MIRKKVSGYNRLLWEMSRPHLLTIAAVIFLSFLGLLFSIINPLIMRTLIDDVLIGSDTALFIPVILAMAGIYFVSALSDYLSGRVNGKFNIVLFTELSSKIFNKIQTSDYSDLTQLKTGDMLFRTTGNVGSIIQVVSTIIPQLVVTIAGIFLPVIIMLSLNAEITFLVLSPVFLFVLSSWYFGNKIKAAQRPVLDSNAGIQSFLKESYSIIPLIKVFRLENWVSGKYDNCLSQYTNTTVESIKVSSMNAGVSRLIYSIPSVLVLLLGGMAVMEGSMTIGTLTAFMSYVSLFFSPVQQLSSLWKMYKSSQASYERIDEIMEYDTDISGEETAEISKGEIVFEDICFSYNDRVILKNFSAKFTRGQNYLIGDNGTGKTTVIKLLCGLYTPQNGNITIDGLNISDMSRDSLRTVVSVVFSDAFLFDGTIAENILFGNLSAAKEDIIKAAKKAGLHDFVMKLADGYETMVGESGLNLSSGEKQKIALARVILRNSPVIIFDEFTRSIDIESKKSIYSVIRELTDKTLIIITHDMNDIEKDGNVVILGKNLYPEVRNRVIEQPSTKRPALSGV